MDAQEYSWQRRFDRESLRDTEPLEDPRTNHYHWYLRAGAQVKMMPNVGRAFVQQSG